MTVEQAIAERDRALDVLEAVMRTLRAQAGGPAEVEAWSTANALLAEHGRGAAHNHEAAIAAWERNRKERDEREARRLARIAERSK